MPCYITLTLLSRLEPVASPRPIIKNMDHITTIQADPDGGAQLWDNGRCTHVAESPGQILALIKEAGK